MDRFDSLFNLSEKVAVVTGASSGLGRRAAEVLALAGAKDWIERRPLSEGSRAFSEIREGKVASPKIVLSPND